MGDLMFMIRAGLMLDCDDSIRLVTRTDYWEDRAETYSDWGFPMFFHTHLVGAVASQAVEEAV